MVYKQTQKVADRSYVTPDCSVLQVYAENAMMGLSNPAVTESLGSEADDNGNWF